LKRLLDILAAFFGLLLLSPVLLVIMVLIWLQDFHSPFYIAARVGKNGRIFQMVKLRSMIIGADKSGVDSTSAGDTRITGVGHFVRKFKLDEISQLWNVLVGDMSLVGPRPNVKRETDLYTDVEKRLLSVRPGITDISSIVFADESDILKDSDDPDIDYNQLIRPWKSRLGLVYIDNRSLWMDLKLIFCTGIAIISREHALQIVHSMLKGLRVPDEIIHVARRKEKLVPHPPPGTDTIVTFR
jgi:lipopolysaccharide/colanic/teichoic acid biosynthesis glycosyltransferase